MTRRRLFALLALLGLTGFTLSSFVVQTPRVRWEVDYRGAAYNTAVPEETNFRHCFRPAGFTDTFGPAFFRTKGFQCSWAAAGTVNGGGGTEGVQVKLVHEDGGIDCQCRLGACNAAASTEVNCTCEDGGYSNVQLGRTIMEDAGEQGTLFHCFQVSDDTDCAGNPSGMSCSIDLFR